MVDREKVIKGLICCAHYIDCGCDECPYDWECSPRENMFSRLATDALALLKEQEAVAPKRIDGKRNHFTKCGNCNHDLMSGYHYCPRCGKAVKWDD